LVGAAGVEELLLPPQATITSARADREASPIVF
jgi:hypothetical protein